MRNKAIIGIVCGLSLGALSVANAQIHPAYFDGFEIAGAFTNNPSYTTNGTGVVVASTPGAPGNALHAVSIENDAFKVETESLANAWCQVFAKPAGYAETPGSNQFTDCSAVFYVNSDGDVMALDADGDNTYEENAGDVWTNLTNIAMTNNQSVNWQGFIVHLDHANTNWEIYHKDDATVDDATYKRLNTHALGMHSAPPAGLTQIEVSSQLGTVIDALGVANAHNLDVQESGLASIVTRTVLHSVNLQRKILIPTNAYDVASAKLSGAMGQIP